MSQQAHLWSRYHAAALQRLDVEAAAVAADRALAEYNKRFEVLSKFEQDLVEQSEVILIRNHQVKVGVRVLLACEQLLKARAHDPRAGVDTHAELEIFSILKNEFKLIEGRYTIVPQGWNEHDPRLRP